MSSAQSKAVYFLGAVDLSNSYNTNTAAITATTVATSFTSSATHLLPPRLTNKPLSGTDCFTPHSSLMSPAITVPCEPETYIRHARRFDEQR